MSNTADWNPQADLGYQEKQQVLASYWRVWGPFRFLVETGVWNGGGSLMQFAGPDVEYVAVEVDRVSAARAWANGFDVRVGDSAKILPFLLAARDGPAFFWLDAHLVNDDRDEQGSPLTAELAAIIAWPHAAGSVVLIDDARMLGIPGWPGARELIGQVEVAGFWDIELRDDLLRLTPAA